MKRQAKEFYEQLKAGLPYESLRGNMQTIRRVHVMVLYEQLIALMNEDMNRGKYRLTAHDLKRAIKVIKTTG